MIPAMHTRLLGLKHLLQTLGPSSLAGAWYLKAPSMELELKESLEGRF